jgi:large subunit ribosomal protein L15
MAKEEDNVAAEPAASPADGAGPAAKDPKPAKPAKDAKPAAEPKPAKAPKPAKEPKESKSVADEAAESVKATGPEDSAGPVPLSGDGEDEDAGSPDTAAGSSKKKERVLKVHHLKPAPGAKKAKTRVGRGESSKGKTAGRGTKGTKARGQVPARLEGGQMPLHMRLPKLRGFKNPFRVEYQVVNLDRLEELYPEGGEVTSADLAARGAVRGRRPVKVLGGGALTVKLDVRVEAASATAREKILAAGGSVEA